MKPTFFILPIAALWAASGTVHGQKPLAPLPPVRTETPAAPVVTAPPEVVASAVAAVSKLGDEVVLGRYQVAVDRMNPMWKERTAKRMGGMQELEKQLAGVAKQMVQQGISMISFKPQGQPRSYEVSPGKKVEKVNGVDVESLVFNKWLVLVPTVTKFRIMQKVEKEVPKVITIDSIQYIDVNGDTQTVAPAAYYPFKDGKGAYVQLTPSYSWPATMARDDAVTVTFTGGLSPVPPAIKAAIFLLVSHMNEFREVQVTEQTFPTGFGLADLIAPFRRVF